MTGCTPALLKNLATLKSPQIRTLIQSNPALWAHPLLLPAILLKYNMNRCEAFLWALDEDVVALEDSIGVSFAGRLRLKRPALLQDSNLPKRSDMRQMTLNTHTTLTEIVFMHRVVAFDHDCAMWLASLNDKIASRTGHEQPASRPLAQRELQDAIKYVENASHTMRGFCATLKERVASQIQVLYSITSQTDNRLSARIAVSSGRDSAAMKTLAFITAVFLPGTYIATLFSMSMFDWQATSPSGSKAISSDSSILSSKFWVYWVITIPLTLIVIISWRLWWVGQDRAYRAQLTGEMDDMFTRNEDVSEVMTFESLRRRANPKMENLD